MPGIDTRPFGQTDDGSQVDLYTCTNRNGLKLKMIDYGAIVVALEVPDRERQFENVTLGFDDLDSYLSGHPFFGATVGRYCNRIALARFTLDGQTYRLAANNGRNHLHGGERGFDKAIWETEPVETDRGVGLRFHYLSPDGEEGYPGNLKVQARYFLTHQDALEIEFMAETDAPTPVNLTNHAYWNLGGGEATDVLGHEIEIVANHFLPVDSELIPTGEIAPVGGTPMDLRRPLRLSGALARLPADLLGFDHCFVLDPTDSGELRVAARAHDPVSGRKMEVHTTQPGLQFYTGNFLSGDESSGGFGRHAVFCLETQRFPDSPNQPDFPGTIVRPGEVYRQLTVHRFSVE